MRGQESGSKGGGVDIVEAGFDGKEQGGDFQSGSLESLYFVHEGEAGVGVTESWQGAALVWVEQASRPSDGGQSDRHYPFEDLGHGFEEKNDAEGGG